MANLITALGLMSGTSMDGIDVALLVTDGENIVERGPSATFEYDRPMRTLLARAMKDASALTDRTARPGCLAEAELIITEKHAEAVESFLQQNAINACDIGLIGFHGQTIVHRPEMRLTVQLGDGPALARRLGIDVAYDMRANDVAHGGQGAPLVPVYHRALAQGLPQGPSAFVNIGGISNVTRVAENGDLLAFDCGPGNALMDDWISRHTARRFDEDGALARSGAPDEAVIESYMQHRFFSLAAPKSLDRGDFTLAGVHNLSAADGAATLAHVTARAIATGARCFHGPVSRWIICGGGRRNSFVMDLLAGYLGADVVTAEQCGFDGDAMEAEAFAYLAVRCARGLPLTYPQTTGVSRPVTGGLMARLTER